MKIVIQRVKQASVHVDNKLVNSINYGMLLLIGFGAEDTLNDLKIMSDKIINLRIFNDNDNVMNKSLIDIKGEILSISQFTLLADTTKGRRPSYSKAMNGEDGIKLYDEFNKILRSNNITVKEGIFGADMDIKLVNDGPVTIVIE